AISGEKKLGSWLPVGHLGLKSPLHLKDARSSVVLTTLAVDHGTGVGCLDRVGIDRVRVSRGRINHIGRILDSPRLVAPLDLRSHIGDHSLFTRIEFIEDDSSVVLIEGQPDDARALAARIYPNDDFLILDVIRCNRVDDVLAILKLIEEHAAEMDEFAV